MSFKLMSFRTGVLAGEESAVAATTKLAPEHVLARECFAAL
jgi:hypothetical protein